MRSCISFDRYHNVKKKPELPDNSANIPFLPGFFSGSNIRILAGKKQIDDGLSVYSSPELPQEKAG